MEKIIKRLHDFSTQRNWHQFHSPVNLAKSIIIEAAELLENFQWDDSEFDKTKVTEEVADVMIYCLQLCMELKVDPLDIINKKLDKNASKYPVEKAFGNSQKYTEFKK